VWGEDAQQSAMDRVFWAWARGRWKAGSDCLWIIDYKNSHAWTRWCGGVLAEGAERMTYAAQMEVLMREK